MFESFVENQELINREFVAMKKNKRVRREILESNLNDLAESETEWNKQAVNTSFNYTLI